MFNQNNKLATVLLWLSGMLAASNICFAAPQHTIVISTGELAPRYSQSLKYDGIMPRIISAAFATEGIKAEFKFFPWKKSLLLAQRGLVDATALWGHDDDRVKHFDYSDPVHQSQWVFFHLKTTDFKWRNFVSLGNTLMAGTIAFTYGEAFYQAEQRKQFKVVWVPEEQQALRLLQKGRVDIVPGQPQVTFFMLSKLFSPPQMEEFAYDPTPFYSFNLHLLFSKKSEGNKALRLAFNRGLQKLKINGTFEQYLTDDLKAGVYSQ